jgi:hypothetical protein
MALARVIMRLLRRDGAAGRRRWVTPSPPGSPTFSFKIEAKTWTLDETFESVQECRKKFEYFCGGGKGNGAVLQKGPPKAVI